jgi:hypothetical protein
MNHTTAPLEEILDEVRRACAKFPLWPIDPLHAVAVLSEEAGELVKATLEAVYEPRKAGPAQMREEAVQVAAMAIRFLGGMDTYDFTPGRQITQRVEEVP